MGREKKERLKKKNEMQKGVAKCNCETSVSFCQRCRPVQKSMQSAEFPSKGNGDICLVLVQCRPKGVLM